MPADAQGSRCLLGVLLARTFRQVEGMSPREFQKNGEGAQLGVNGNLGCGKWEAMNYDILTRTNVYAILRCDKESCWRGELAC